MPLYELTTRFVFNTIVRIEAPNPQIAEAMFMGANNDQIAHINGKSYASAGDADRYVDSIVEII